VTGVSHCPTPTDARYMAFPQIHKRIICGNAGLLCGNIGLVGANIGIFFGNTGLFCGIVGWDFSQLREFTLSYTNCQIWGFLAEMYSSLAEM